MEESAASGGGRTTLAFGAADLPRVREHVATIVAQVAPQRVAEVVLAVHEVAANSIVHGAGDGCLRVWSADGELVFEVVDSDGTTTVPTIGTAAPGALSGRGLWLAQQLTDAMAVSSTPGRTTVQLRVSVPSGAMTVGPQSAVSTGDLPSTASVTVG